MRKNKRSPDMLNSAECRYSIEVLHVKSLSPCMKDDVLNSLHLFSIMWVMDE